MHLNLFSNFGKDLFVNLKPKGIIFERAFVTDFLKKSQVNLVMIFSVILSENSLRWGLVFFLEVGGPFRPRKRRKMLSKS
jgi:hypothetical protein